MKSKVLVLYDNVQNLDPHCLQNMEGFCRKVVEI